MPSGGPGTSSAIPASVPTRTCTPWVTRSGPGMARSRSPTATPYCSTSRKPPGNPASTPTFASTTGSLQPAGRHPTRARRITAERTDTNESLEFTASFLFSCSGYYRYDHGYLPDFAGVADFAGTVVHPQAWPQGLDVTGKRVVVIGSGATAVTLVPALARSAAHVTMLQRSPSYIASLPEKSPVVAMLRKVLPAQQAGTAAKWFHALLTQAFYGVSRKYPKLVRRMLSKGLERQLPAGYDIDTHFTPRYNPWDQRFCAVPNGDLFKAISAGSASVVTDRIERFTESGLLLSSGEELEADVVVTATGLELLFLGGIALSVDCVPVDPSSRLIYKGMMLEGVPNMALAIGYINASWTLKCDLTCDYVCRLLNYMRDNALTECVPRNKHGATATSEPVLGLTSGYIQRSAHLLPKQGTGDPWKVHQSYWRDYRALRMNDIDDSIMEFSGRRTQVKVLDPATP